MYTKWNGDELYICLCIDNLKAQNDKNSTIGHEEFLSRFISVIDISVSFARATNK